MLRQYGLMVVVALVCFCAGMSAPLAATPMNLSKTPLFLNAAVDPNVMVTFDDSGSMTFGFVPDSVDDGDCAFRYKRYYSAAYNKIYYNPAISYEPPLDATGKSLGNQSFSAALSNGFDSTSTKVNLGSAYFVTYNPNDGNPKIDYKAGATSTSSCSSYNYDFPTGSASAFYCKLKTPASNPNLDASYDCQAPTAAEQTNFANWFSYYRYRSNALKSAVARSFGVLDDDIRVAWQNMHKNPIAATTTIDRFNGTPRTNFFKWLFGSPASGNTPTLDSTIRVGSFFSRATGNVNTNPYWDATLGKELSCRQNYHVLVTDGYWNQSNSTKNGHPSFAAASYATTTNVTLPDGRKYSTTDTTTAPFSKLIWNEDKRGANCESSDKICNPDYTDLSFYYWSRDLRPDLVNNVSPYIPDRSTGIVNGTAVDLTKVANLLDVPEIYWNPANDPANWQHVDQYFVGFGISGKLPFNDTTYLALRKGTTAWPGALNNAPEAVDDSWHAALASRGKAFSATDPNAIVESLTDVLSSIVARKGSAAAVSVATGIVTGSTLTYQTVYDSTDVSGSVLARKVNANFVFDSKPLWDAGCILTGGDCAATGTTETARPNWNTGRQILTSTGSGAGLGAAFRYGSLSTAQQTLLNKNPQTGTVDSLGSDRVDYIRGSRDKEKKSGGTFRNRNSLFGAVVDSSAEFVCPPRENYDQQLSALTEAKSYAAFKKTYANRAGMVYVGANDGMLHALDGTTGEEKWAYIPAAVYPRLGQLTNPLFQFENYVDNTPSVRDAYVNGKWSTILVGTLRRGGQGVFALNVTANASESSPSSTVLWDLTDAADAELGYTYGKPFITRLSNGKWVALVPAGYNSQEADTLTGTGKSVLFVLDLADGSVLRRFDVASEGGDATSTGLAAPMAIDTNSDEVSDYAYAGDLNGNLWRFDFTGTKPSGWSVSRLFKPTTAFERPITAQPRVLRHPTLGLPIVLVGTGKFIETGDRSPSIPTQAFYGIRDDGSTITQADLSTADVTPTATANRKVGAFSTPTGGSKGWQIQFSDSANSPGERVIAPAAIRIVNNEVIFSTLIPGGDDPCIPGGRSFLMFADALTGSSSPDGVAFFDVNGDKKIDGSDDKDVQGKRIDSLIPGVASILQQGGGVGGIVLPGTGVDGTPPEPIRTREYEWRRRGWREKFLHQ